MRPRRPGIVVVSVCWLCASAASPAPCTPWIHAARVSATMSRHRRVANRSPMRRSIRRIARYGAATPPLAVVDAVVGPAAPVEVGGAGAVAPGVAVVAVVAVVVVVAGAVVVVPAGAAVVVAAVVAPAAGAGEVAVAAVVVAAVEPAAGAVGAAFAISPATRRRAAARAAPGCQ